MIDYVGCFPRRQGEVSPSSGPTILGPAVPTIVDYKLCCPRVRSPGQDMCIAASFLMSLQGSGRPLQGLAELKILAFEDPSEGHAQRGIGTPDSRRTGSAQEAGCSKCK